jgi:hypothetical protein
MCQGPGTAAPDTQTGSIFGSSPTKVEPARPILPSGAEHCLIGWPLVAYTDSFWAAGQDQPARFRATLGPLPRVAWLTTSKCDPQGHLSTTNTVPLFSERGIVWYSWFSSALFEAVIHLHSILKVLKRRVFLLQWTCAIATDFLARPGRSLRHSFGLDPDPRPPVPLDNNTSPKKQPGTEQFARPSSHLYMLSALFPLHRRQHPRRAY